MRTPRPETLVDRHRVDNILRDIKLCDPVGLHIDPGLLAERVPPSQDGTLDSDKNVDHTNNLQQSPVRA